MTEQRFSFPFAICLFATVAKNKIACICRVPFTMLTKQYAQSVGQFFARNSDDDTAYNYTAQATGQYWSTHNANAQNVSTRRNGPRDRDPRLDAPRPFRPRAETQLEFLQDRDVEHFVPARRDRDVCMSRDGLETEKSRRSTPPCYCSLTGASEWWRGGEWRPQYLDMVMGRIPTEAESVLAIVYKISAESRHTGPGIGSRNALILFVNFCGDSYA